MANLEKKFDFQEDVLQWQPIDMTIDQLQDWFYWYIQSQRCANLEEEDEIHVLYYNLMWLMRKVRDENKK